MTTKKAREIIAQAFHDDIEYRNGYVDNVACLLMDRIPGLKKNKAKRDEIADAIIHLIFE